MLIKVKVSNFMSIGQLQELCMISGKVRGKREHLYKSKNISLLRLSAIYGANASGKSNLIKALEFSKQVIVEEIPKGYINKYNRTNEENINKPSYFEFEIKIDKKYYSYGFEIILNKSSIISEWLYELSTDNHRIEIFYRNLSNKKFSLGKHFKNEDIINRLKIYFDDTKFEDSILFLSEMNRNKSDLYKKKSELIVFSNVFGWFKNSLDINHPERVFSNYSYFGVITASVTPGAKYMVYIQKTFSVLCPEGFFNFYYPEILYISIGNLSFIFKSKFPYGLT